LVNLVIPEPSLVVLIGPSGSGKSTFAKKRFQLTEIVSSDRCRALISDDENDQSVTLEAFELLHLIVSRRLRKHRLTVVDATNVQARSRRTLLALARKYAVPAIAVVFDLAESTCVANNSKRPQRSVPAQVVATQVLDLRTSLPQLGDEGYAGIFVLKDSNELDQAVIIRRRSPDYRSGDLRATERLPHNWLQKLIRAFRRS
jgi:protein phosphatase